MIEVTRPFASTVTCGTTLAEPYVPAVAPDEASVGLGYVPVRSPPAAPEGGPLATGTAETPTTRPFASTVNCGTFDAFP